MNEINNLYNEKKINDLISIWENMKNKMYPIPKKFNINEINNILNNNSVLNLNENDHDYMIKAYKYYQNKNVPMPYDLYILLTEENMINNLDLVKCKEFDDNYNYKRMFSKDTYKIKKINYYNFNDFDNTKEWKVFLNNI
jgi:hypothetical protein